jgi:hypothetical protein
MKASGRHRALICLLVACFVGMLGFAGVGSAAVSHWSVQATPRLEPGGRAVRGVMRIERVVCRCRRSRLPTVLQRNLGTAVRRSLERPGVVASAAADSRP